MSVNDVTSGILAPALQVKRLQKREPNQKLWRRSQASKNRCVGIFKRRDIIFNRISIFLFSSNLCCVTHLEQIQFTFFHLLRFPLKGGCSGSSESTLVKMPHCWKSRATAQIFFILYIYDTKVVSIWFPDLSVALE